MSKKVVVITGASSGLGKELAKIYTQKECILILSGRNKNKLNMLRKDNVDVVAGDLRQDQTLNNIADVVINKYKRIDILINNAGILYIQPFEKNTDDQLDTIFHINVKSHIKLTQRLYSFMKKQYFGHIINIISTAGMEGKMNHTLYCATKYAMRGFTESLRLEAKKFNIKVTGIYPGGIKTSIFKNLSQKIDRSTFMEPADIAQTIYNISTVGNMCPDSLVISRMHWVNDPLYGNTD